MRHPYEIALQKSSTLSMKFISKEPMGNKMALKINTLLPKFRSFLPYILPPIGINEALKLLTNLTFD